VQKLSQWIRTSTGGVPENIGGGYRLDGTPLNTWEDTFFIAPFAVAAMTGSSAADQAWLNSLYNYIHQRHNTDDYYADTVTLQSLLAVTGNFWDPQAVLESTPRTGDYDLNGRVEQEDYTAWRNAFGSTTSPAVDGNGNGFVDAADYTVWRNAYENGGSGSDVGASLAVPEPLTTIAAVVGLFGLLAFTRSPSRANRFRSSRGGDRIRAGS
jgi:hypothetical protein